MKKLVLLLIAFAWTSSSCEKDDICDAATVTTPRLIVTFYDISNPTVTKNVTNLAIIGDGLTTGLLFNGVSVIQVPLNISADVTKYHFVLNYQNANTALINEDILEFNYSRKNLYVSRACGYKTVFNLSDSTPFSLTDATTGDGFWIKNATVTQTYIQNENETHLSIAF